MSEINDKELEMATGGVEHRIDGTTLHIETYCCDKYEGKGGYNPFTFCGNCAHGQRLSRGRSGDIICELGVE